MDAEIVLLVGGLHLVAMVFAGILIAFCLRSEETPPFSPGQDGDDGGGGSDRRVPRDPPRPRGGGLPLPDAAPARVRLRGAATLATLLAGRDRRPAREPARPPAPARHHRV